MHYKSLKKKHIILQKFIRIFRAATSFQTMRSLKSARDDVLILQSAFIRDTANTIEQPRVCIFGNFYPLE